MAKAQYTQIPTRIWKELKELKKGEYDWEKAKVSPSYFAHHVLKIPPFRYQHMILRRFRKDSKVKLKNGRIIIVKPRQIGISWCIAFLAAWYAATNASPSGPHKDTKVGVISRSAGQAVKLMGLIQKLIFKSKISQMVIKERGASLSKTEIHFKNGWIKCYPPNDACRGETFDLLIVDEAAFVDDEFFTDAMEPTVSATDGNIILSSTPKGQSGFFFELCDPFDLYEKHEYDRYWFHWKMVENDGQRKTILKKFDSAKQTGNLKGFDQEYNALFTVDKEAFFEDADVEKGIDKDISPLYEMLGAPCSIGLDYGMTDSATAITVVAKFKDRLQLLYQVAEKELDENLLMDPSWADSIPNLCKRYNIVAVVVDDCPMGNRTNKQLENEGFPVQRFNFRSQQAAGDKQRTHYGFRSELKQNRVKYPNIRPLLAEMKSLQEIRTEIGVKIKAPRTYTDDRIDSFIMACHPFLADEGQFGSTLVDYRDIMREQKELNISYKDPRTDSVWDKAKIADIWAEEEWN